MRSNCCWIGGEGGDQVTGRAASGSWGSNSRGEIGFVISHQRVYKARYSGGNLLRGCSHCRGREESVISDIRSSNGPELDALVVASTGSEGLNEEINFGDLIKWLARISK